MNWKDLSPEQQEEVRARRKESKLRRLRYEKGKEERRRERYAADDTCAKIKPGDWVRHRAGGRMDLYDKVCRILEWDDDGHNHKRAPRNKEVIVEIEPHLHDEPERVRCRLWGFEPVSAMEVLAETAR